VRCWHIVKLNEQGNKKTKWLAVCFGDHLLAEGYGENSIPLAAFLCNDSLPSYFQRLDGTFLLLFDSRGTFAVEPHDYEKRTASLTIMVLVFISNSQTIE
jgi:hypothetical protein